MNLILFVLLAFQTHRMAQMRGLSPWPYLMHFTAIFFLTLLGVGFVVAAIVGVDKIQDEEGKSMILMLQPFAMLFQIFLFIYFRKKIQKAVVNTNDDDDYTPPPNPPKEKKDLSYFR